MNFSSENDGSLDTPLFDKQPTLTNNNHHSSNSNNHHPYTISSSSSAIHDVENLSHPYPYDYSTSSLSSHPKKSSSQTNNNDIPPPSLNEINYVNLLTFLVNSIITYLVGVAGVGDFESNKDISERYQSIVTPAGYTFSIWSFIFFTQGIFTIVQLLPKYRAIPIIQVGINYWYFFASLFQIGWTLTFSYELIPISLVMMLFILVSIIGLVISQGKIIKRLELEHYSWREYWSLIFPFEVLCGWIIAAFAVNLNVLVVFLNTSAETQLIYGIASLVGFYAVGVIMTCATKDATYVIPLVMAWATFGINAELRKPKESILNSFSVDAIDGVKTAAVAVSIIILLQIAVRVTYHRGSQRHHH